MAPLVCSPVVIPFSPFASPSPFSLSSPLQSSSHHDEYRVLEVEAAVLNGGNRASVKLWVYHGEKLVAKVDNVRGPNSSAWNHKFVFAVTDDFLRDEDASLFVDIYNGPILGGLVGKKKFVATAKCCFKDVLSGILLEEEEKATCCTIPISTGISGCIAGAHDGSSSSAMNLNLKLRIWKEVLHYMAP